MPTGYTNKLYNGTPVTFPEFALDCARAFGANIMLRDEGGGGEKIPEQFEPSPWHRDSAEKARRELERVLAMTPAEADAAARNAWHEAESRRQKQVQQSAAVRERYEAMLAHVRAWTPPTSEHVGLKEFMAQQLTRSIEFDCDHDYYATPKPKLSGEHWRTDQISSLQRDIERDDRYYAEEIERNNMRNAWNRALRESLK